MQLDTDAGDLVEEEYDGDEDANADPELEEKRDEEAEEAKDGSTETESLPPG